MANALWNSSRRPSHSLSVKSTATSCVRRTWHAHEPQQGVHAGYTENDARVIPFKSRRKNGGGGGESEYSGVLKTRNLLIFPDAKNAENCKIELNCNVSGTRDFQLAGQFCEEDRTSTIGAS